MTVYVALLRAVNVAGHGRLAMARLRDLCAEAGAEDVRTYLQSGNAVFSSSVPAPELRASLEERLGVELGLPATAVLRTADAFRRAAEANPFLAEDAPPSALYASFLDAEPEADRVAQLDPERGAPDAFRVVGDTIYLHLPTGAGSTKLTNVWFERQLGVAATARNWRTVTALAELAAG